MIDFVWRQGITLKTPETQHWTAEQFEASNAVERCLVFANFNYDDGGRSRQLVATCKTEDDARFIAAAPEMYQLIENVAAAYDHDKSSHDLAATLYELRCKALQLLEKLKEGGEAR